MEDLPDPNNELLAYLPSRAAEGEESGLSQKKAEAMCRRLVAVHCLYGVDKNPLAVELAKLSLWLESYAEGLPLTFLDHRLICGDSLTGPFFDHLLTYPKNGGRLDDLFAQGLTERLEDTLAAALEHVRDLEASVGKDLADLHQKESAKRKLDVALAPLKALAAAWAGGVMLGDDCDDSAYKQLAEEISQGHNISDSCLQHKGLTEMLRLGRAAVPYQLSFPEVFYRSGAPWGGFDAVLGNPPWDAIQFKSKEFLAGFDLGILEAPTANARALVENRLTSDPLVNLRLSAEQESFERAKRVNDKLYRYQKVIIDGDLAGRQLDAFRVFMERNAQLLGKGGFTGVVVPSAFHANAGATGVRQLYLERMALQCCFSFENRNKLFDIHSSFKFAAVVGKNDPAGSSDFSCGFYWHDANQLFTKEKAFPYSLSIARKAGGQFLNLPEANDLSGVSLLRSLSDGAENNLSEFADRYGIRFRMTELHTTHDASRFRSLNSADGDPRKPAQLSALLENNQLCLAEGKAFHQYDSLWGEAPQYSVPLSELQDKPSVISPSRFFRLAFRKVASSTNERTAISAVLPPGVVFADNTISEMDPSGRPYYSALCLNSIGNSFCFDWIIRLKVAATVSLFILRQGLIPALSQEKTKFLAHCALRLTCNHEGYSPLWADQLNEEWREQSQIPSWPVLPDESSRWLVRAAIDAVVADSFGLDRSGYEQVLSGFNHRSYPEAKFICLEAFDELREIGFEEYAQKYDPYWDIPLNQSLPRPVIDLAIPGQAGSGLGPLFDGAAAEAIVPAQPPIKASSSTAVLPRQHRVSATTSPSAKCAFATIAELLRSRGVITSSDAQQATGLDAAGVRPYLQQLVQQGLAVSEGQRRGMRYKLANTS